MDRINQEIIKDKYDVESITINGCILVPFYQVEDKLRKLEKIEQIVNDCKWGNRLITAWEQIQEVLEKE